jgi:sugar/nucleoside kinase (ribokinase family)
VGEVLGLNIANKTRDGLAALAIEIQKRTTVGTLVVHPVTYALAASAGGAVAVGGGPVVQTPLITTGAGDHFNSGFCLGKLLGCDNATSLLCGVSTSGHYVRTAQSPGVEDLATMMRNWPARS